MGSKIAFILLKTLQSEKGRKILLGIIIGIVCLPIILLGAFFCIFQSTQNTGGGGQFRWPIDPQYKLDESDVTNLFGDRVHPIFGDIRTHTGIDIQAPNGSQCYAIGKGTVLQVGSNGGWGNTITLSLGKDKEGKEITCVYCHLTPGSFSLNVGDAVEKGQEIALTGTTGQTQGGHIHFEMKLDGVYVDPMNYISTSPPGEGVERWRSTVVKALEMNGLSTSDDLVNKVLRQIETESGGDEQITQGILDSNSGKRIPFNNGVCPWCPNNNGEHCGNNDVGHGLMQTIPSTFNSNKLPGHDDVFNGYDCLLAALNYAKNRYGPNLDGLGEGHGY